MSRSARAGPISLQDRRLPIVAIGSKGAVTKVNGPARKILGDDVQSFEGASLGALVAGYFTRRHKTGGIASLSLMAHDDEAAEAQLTIVLSDEQDEESPEPDVANHERDEVCSGKNERRLLDYLAHELKSPLGSVKSWSRILRLRFETISHSDRVAALHFIETDAERALLIVEGLLSLAQRRRRPSKEAPLIPLHAVLRNVVAAHQRRNPERKVILSGDSPLYVSADSMGVELALANLLNNAEKYAPPSTSIEVASHQEGNRVTVLVVNEGTSLPVDRYRRLWDIYSRGPDPDIAVSGSGIGLALCKELVEMMGGRVWAGPRDNGGSIFAVTLPTSDEAAPPSPSGAPVIDLAPRAA